MAASAIAWMLGGSAEQCMAASSLALQNSLGMICDPIAARVEAPCLGKNVSSALNAMACANMAIAGYDHLIPLDEVIETMDRVGKSLPHELRCTALTPLFRDSNMDFSGPGFYSPQHHYSARTCFYFYSVEA
jgi:L-serine dehydratase